MTKRVQIAAVVGAVLVVAMGARVVGQSVPTLSREYIRLGGRVVAVETPNAPTAPKLTIIGVANGTTTPGAGVISSNYPTSITASPSSGYTLTGWTCSGLITNCPVDPVNPNTLQLPSITGDLIVTPNFTMNGYFSLTIGAATGGGTDWPLATVTNWPSGTTPTPPTVTATANAGYSLTGWSCPGITCSGNTVTLPPMVQNLTVTPIFAPNTVQYSVTLGVNGNGGYLTPSAGVTYYNSGSAPSSQTVTAYAYNNYTFVNWTSCSGVTNCNAGGNVLTLPTTITGNVSATANFTYTPTNPLLISPAYPTTRTQSVAFSHNSTTNYTWTIRHQGTNAAFQSPADGTFNVNTGLYTPPASLATDQVFIVGLQGQTAEAELTVLSSGATHPFITSVLTSPVGESSGASGKFVVNARDDSGLSPKFADSLGWLQVVFNQQAGTTNNPNLYGYCFFEYGYQSNVMYLSNVGWDTVGFGTPGTAGTGTWDANACKMSSLLSSSSITGNDGQLQAQVTEFKPFLSGPLYAHARLGIGAWEKVYDWNVPGDTTKPVITGVGHGGQTVATAILSWTTSNDASTSDVDYGTTPAYGATATVGGYVENHSVQLQGLSSNTDYYYRVRSKDAAGNIADPVVGGPVKTTAAAGLPSAPLSVNAMPTDGGVSLTWAAVSGANTYTVKRSLTSGGTYAVLTPTVVHPTTTFLDSGLTNGTTYYYKVSATNSFGQSPDSVAASATPSTGLIGYWALNEATGTAAADGSGGGYGGTLNNGASWTQGRIGNGVNFDGSNDYVQMASGIAQLGAFSVSMWVKPTATTGYLISRRDSGCTTGFWRLDNASNSLSWIRSYSQGNVTVASSGPVLTPGSWAHVVITSDNGLQATGTKIYVNGVQISYGSQINGTGNTPQNGDSGCLVRLGRRSDGTSPFGGVLDDVRIYNRVLIASEISGLYNLAPPLAPAGVTAAVGGSGKVLVGWTPVVGAISYTVRRSTVNGGPYSIVDNGETLTSFLDTGLVSGTTYYYVVTASNGNGESVTSSQVSAVALSTPVVTKVLGSGSVVLSWGAVPGAVSYTVRKSTSSGSGYTDTAGASSPFTSGSLTNGTTYYYVVRAVNGFGFVDSLEVAAKPIAVPSGLAGVPASGQVSLSWGAVAGATGYKVWRSVTSGTGFSELIQVGGASHVDTGLTNGTVYYYKVSALNVTGEGALSAEVAVTAGVPQVPGAPASVTAVAGDRQVMLSWPAVSGALSYVVTRVGGPDAFVSLNAHVDVGLTNGTAYTYQVKAVNAVGTGAATSASATPVVALASGLVSHLRMDETSGVSAADSVGSNTGTLTNGPVWGAGRVGGGLTFDGVDDLVDAGTGSLGQLTAFSTAFWIKPQASLAGYIVSRRDAGCTGFWRLGYESGSLALFRPQSNGDATSVTGLLSSTTTWRHVVVTSDDPTTGNGARIYVDGVEVGYLSRGTTTGTTVSDAGCVLRYGARGTPSEFMEGTMDDARLYNRVLSASEVSSLYSGMVPATVVGLGATAGAGSVTLNWTGSAGAVGYTVKRGSSSGGPWTTVATGVSGTSYVVGGLTGGSTYYFVVTAVNAGGGSSVHSVVVSGVAQ